MILALLMFSCNEDKEFATIFENLTLTNGLVLDRISDQNTVSCASTGLVSYSKAILYDKKVLPKSTIEFIKNGFKTTVINNPKENNGWLCHFTDSLGKSKEYSEVSTIDTAIFYLSYLKIAELIKDDDFHKEIIVSIEAIDKSLMLKDGYFMHGFIWKNNEMILLNELWDDYNEGVLIYRLFNMPFHPIIDSPNLPLFAYYYPLCFYNDEQYVSRLASAVIYQKETFGYAGVTACDGPEGYQAGDPDVISPLSLYAASQFCEIAKEELMKIPHNRMTPSYSRTINWISNDKLGIDYGSCFICTRK